MNDVSTETLSVSVERELNYPPEKIWRALTQPHLISEWLMQNNFTPNVGHHFSLSADWGVVDCKILAIDPYKTLIYTWNTKDLESVVTWTLMRTNKGTQLRMTQEGFRRDQQPYYRGATAGWQRFFANLESVIVNMD